MGDVFHVGEEAEEGAAFEGDVVADGAAELGVESFEGVEGLGEGDGMWDVEGDLVAGDVGEAAKVEGEFDADEGHKDGIADAEESILEG